MKNLYIIILILIGSILLLCTITHVMENSEQITRLEGKVDSLSSLVAFRDSILMDQIQEQEHLTDGVYEKILKPWK